MTTTAPDVVLLRAAGVCLAVALDRPVPAVLHWGADLGPATGTVLTALADTSVPAVLNNAPDVPRVFSVWPTEHDGWAGTPAQQGHVDGRATTPRLVLDRYEHTVHDGRPADASGTAADATATGTAADLGSGGELALFFTDAVSGTRPEVRYTLDAAGVLDVRLGLVRDASLTLPGHEALADLPYTLTSLTALLPLPARATEIVDHSGKWCRERAPQRLPIAFGTHRRDAHRGKPGHDAPYLTLAGTAGFGDGHGEVWGLHVAWSGDAHTVVELLPEGAGVHRAVLGGGGSLAPGEVRLHDGERYDAPPVLLTWSDAGTDGVAARFHDRLRARTSHPASPRPLVLNTWEAVYFDHDQDRLAELVDLAALVGVERVVLDDGWFTGRRDDTTGLGDWQVDTDVWPDGLGPFVDRVRSHGMEFGLWFEPEMVNLGSRLAQEHPGWVLAPSVGVGAPARHQYVLDLAVPEAFEHVLAEMSGIVEQYAVDFIKWDHNRDLSEAVRRDPGGDLPSVRAQTLAFYALLDALRDRFPALEIESCSGGGGRVDLGVLDRTDRVWSSDCNDPVERFRLDRSTMSLVPPELVGTHVGAPISHTTHRAAADSFRLAVALLTHAGIEWDLTRCTPEEIALLRTWAGLYREVRPLVHTGRVVNADLPGDDAHLRGVVATDGSRALFVWLRTETSPYGQPGRVQLPGLDPAATYRVRLREELGAATRHQVSDPAWVTAATQTGVTLPGVLLTTVGVPLPMLAPQQAMLLDVVRV